MNTVVPTLPGEERTSVLEVLAFVGSYWRNVPLRFAGMLAGTSIGVLIEIQIPRISADFVVATERHLQGTADASAAWNLAWLLLGTFAAIFVVKQLYLRNWMYLTSQVMQKLVTDGFRQVQRFSLDWHSNHFAGSTQRRITRGMWAYDSLADTRIVEEGSHADLIQRPEGHYRKLVEMQTFGFTDPLELEPTG